MIRNNDIALYFLADRDGPGKYYELFPGVATQQPAQREIVAALERERVRFIIVLSGTFRSEPNLSSVSSGVFILDEFIRRHFRPVARFERHVVWERVE
jgi:hypothetical protein